MRRAAALVALVLAGACGVPEEEEAVVVRDQDVPFDLLAPSTTTTSTTSTTVPEVPVDRIVEVCLVQSDGGVVPIERTLARRRTLDEVMEALRRGPTADESRFGLSTGLPAPEALGAVSLSGGTAAVALGEAFVQAPAPTQVVAIAQVVCTLTGQPGVGRVQFTYQGQPVQVPLPDGSLAGGSVSRDDYASLLRPGGARATPRGAPGEGTGEA